MEYMKKALRDMEDKNKHFWNLPSSTNREYMLELDNSCLHVKSLKANTKKLEIKPLLLYQYREEIEERLNQPNRRVEKR